MEKFWREVCLHFRKLLGEASAGEKHFRRTITPPGYRTLPEIDKKVRGINHF